MNSLSLHGTRSFAMRALLAACALFAGCASVERNEPVQPPPPAAAAPPEPVQPPPAMAPAQPALQQRGRISLYGDAFAGKRTASGDTFDPDRLTMAHPTLPFGTHVRVTNLENQKSVEVVVNDRGPFVRGRIADLSAAAARQIGMVVDGVVDAVLEVMQPVRGH